MRAGQSMNKLLVMGVFTSSLLLAGDNAVESIGFNAGITKLKYIVDSQVTSTPKTVGSSFEGYVTLSNVFSNKNIKPSLHYIYNTNSDVKNHTGLIGLNQHYQFNYFNFYSGLLVGYGKLELNGDYSLKSVVGAAQVGLEFPMTQRFSFNFNSKFFVHNYESDLNSAPYMMSASVGLKYTFGATKEDFIVTDMKTKSKEKVQKAPEKITVGEEWSFEDTIDLEPSSQKSEIIKPQEINKVEEKVAGVVVAKPEIVEPVEERAPVEEKKVEKKVALKKSQSKEQAMFKESNVDEMDFDWLLEEDFDALGESSSKNKKDSDHDGVPDKEDLCVDTIAGEIVDSSGCAKDTDGDGVIDRVDKCPNSVVDEIVDARGCAKDSDLDGIVDRLDRCSNSLANEIVDQKGCAKDTDGDGVVDRADKCLNTPKGQVVNEFGCSEKVFDTKTRVALYQNKPVEIKKPQISNLATPPSAPAVATTTQSGYPSRLNFPYKAQKVDEEQNKQLDRLASYLIAHPEYELFMKSYTDSIGSAQYNFNLAAKRAQSVTDQLVDRGVNRARISYESMGEKDPIASNMLKAGREKNRRIDIFLIKR
jgi:OOP family OmpA-OmpF porin